MVYSLPGLRHYSIIGSNDQHSDVSDPCSASPHRSKCLMAGGIDESDFLSINRHLVSTYVLSNLADFTISDIAVPDSVEKTGLAMVNMS
ncbi:MAG: hypothetical protein DDT24_00850 [Chloroflexi bacterium]|nr:hypothetical protein [Chloroflexota bacterium]